MTEKITTEIKDYEKFKRLETLKNEQKSLEKSIINEENRKKLNTIKKEIKILRDELVQDYLYICEILAKKYSNKGIEYEDLYQIASLGLILAVDRFNIDRGFEFASYATPTVTGEIKRYFRDKGWVIKVPRRIQELSKRINSAKADLIQRLKRNPSIDEIAELLEISSEEVIEVMDASQVYSPHSFDKALDSSSEDSNTSFQDIIGEVDNSFRMIEDMNFIKETMEKLPDIERKIIFYRFYDKMTQAAIAQKLEISQMTVSRLEKKAIKTFRAELGME